jgi:chromosomal replication initiator protein
MPLETQDPHEIWAQCLLSIERQVKAQSFSNWFRPTQVVRFDDENLVIQVPSIVSADWLEKHYLDLIRSVVAEETDLQPNISFTIEGNTPNVEGQTSRVPAVLPSSNAQQTTTTASTNSPTTPAAQNNPVDDNHSEPFTSLNSSYSFDTYVIGEGNRFAHAAALAVANSPGKTQFNPLFIFGGVGLGKTHLLQAIGNHARVNNLAKRVAYVPSEKFMSDFIESLKNRNAANFQRLYRSADILLIDDIQFLFLRGEHTQTEFFHTFNALHQNGKQIVMTCDSPPEKLGGLEERLLSRFQWGLVTPIEPPDLETRIAILHQKAEINGIPLPSDVAAFLGSYISSNVRELEGALIHLMAYCSVHNTELSIEAAKHIARERGPNPTTELSIEAIQKHISDHFDLTLDLLVSKTRKQEVATARQVAMFLAKRFTPHPLKVIGFHFGKRDHSTVVHAVQTVEKKCKRDPSFARMIDELIEEIQQKYASSF